MAENKPPQESTPQNEGEGNCTAAREYNEAQHRFVQSGKVDKKRGSRAGARHPESAMERAEAIGKATSGPRIRKLPAP
jgi:hypothetical protein